MRTDPFFLPDATPDEQLAEAAAFATCPVTLSADDVSLLVDALRLGDEDHRWWGLETLREKCGEQREYERSGRWMEEAG